MSVCKLARLKDAKRIAQIFASHSPWTDHVRYDYLQRMLKRSTVVFYHGVVIVYTVYAKKTRLGKDVIASKGDCVIHQIATHKKMLGTGASAKVLGTFLHNMRHSDIYLSVRKDNARAIRFYTRVGFIKVGEVVWTKKGRPLPGEVYVKPAKTALTFD